MSDKDSLNLEKLYLEKVIQEIHADPDPDFNNKSKSKFGRFKDRYFQNLDFSPSDEEDYLSPEDLDLDNKQGEEVKAPHKIDISKIDRDSKIELVGIMSMLRHQIDDVFHKDPFKVGFKSLSSNRKLMDEVISDIVLGFAKGSPLKHRIAGLIPNTETPTFYVRNYSGGDDIIRVELPYGPKSNYEDVKYIIL